MRVAPAFYWIPCLLQCAISDCTLARNDGGKGASTIGKARPPLVQGQALLTIERKYDGGSDGT